MAGEEIAVGKGTNHGFARKLASSDKNTREKAVALLVLWLSCQQEIGEDELKKIWKGLFYCIWHTDKVPVQAELMERLAGLLESVDIELSVSFFKVFLSTMRREWGGIDRLRLDKFYLLLRKFISHMFKVLDKGGWDKDLVTRFMDALEERAFLAKDRFPALGVNLHLTDIFWDEFRKFLPVPDGTLGLLLEPFYSTLSASSDKALLRRVRENVFESLLNDCRILVKTLEQRHDLDGTAGRVGYLLNSATVAPRLFDLASSPAIAQANRKVLYELNDEFSKLAKSLESSNGIVANLSANDNSGLKGSNDIIFVPNLEDTIEKRSLDADEGSRTTSGKRQAPSAAMGVNLPVQKVRKLAHKKPKKSNLSQSLLDIGAKEDQETEPAGNGVSLGVPIENKDEREVQETVLKSKRNSRTSASALKNDVPVSEKKVGKKKVKKIRKAPSKPIRVDSSDVDAVSLHAQEKNRADLDLRASGELDTCAQSLDIDNIPVDVNDVSINLEMKFDCVAGEEMTDSQTILSKNVSLANEVSVSGPLLITRETRSKKKRKRERADPPTVQVGAKTGVDDDSSNEPVKKVKQVRFALWNNLYCKPHGPLPPLLMRTPPSATPRGSALKSGVRPGPIRTRPIRVARGTGLLKSRRRAPRPYLTMLLQKPKSSKKKLRKR